MDPRSDPRVKVFGDYVEKTHMLWSVLDRAFASEIEAIDTDRRLANPGKGDNVSYLKEFRANLGDLQAIRTRHAAAKLRFQLHVTKGRPIKQACLDAVCELLLDAVGGETGLTDCPIGPLAEHYLNEIQQARPWPPAGATSQKVNLHLSEVWKAVETAIGESDLIRRERKTPPPWLVERFETRQRTERLAALLSPHQPHHSRPRRRPASGMSPNGSVPDPVSCHPCIPLPAILGRRGGIPCEPSGGSGPAPCRTGRRSKSAED